MAAKKPKEARDLNQRGAPKQQFKVRTELRAGIDADCTQGLSYWRKEYNKLKAYAQSIHCA